MQNSKHKLQIFQNGHMQAAGIFLLILLAVLLLWFNNVNSTQALSATVAKVRFYGEYRIGDGQWQEITEGKHIPATKGDVTLRGNFHMLTPDGEYIGIYRGESTDFVYHDTSDLDMGEILYYPGSFLIGEVTDYHFTPGNTTIRVENGQIMEMHRIYTP